MNSNKIGVGIFLITIGVLWTLMSIGALNWSIVDAITKLWPLILVAIGINVMFRNNAVVRIVVWLGLIAALIVYGTYFGTTDFKGGKPVNNNIVEEKFAETKNGNLKLGLGGLELNLDSTQTNLLEAGISGRDMTYSTQYGNGKETAEVSFNRSNYSIVNNGSYNDNFDLHLNNDVVWNMDVKAGAIKGYFDMSDLKVKDMDVNCGAGKFDLIFGSKYNQTNLRINGGASSFDVTVPAASGVRVRMEDALTGTNLNGLGWEKRDNYYVSPNYDTAGNKIDINVHLGVGKFDVNVK